MSHEKKYTAKEAALAVLKKAHEMLLKAEQPGMGMVEKEKDQTPPDGVQPNSPDLPTAEEPTLGDKVNKVVEEHLAEKENKPEVESEDNLKGHLKLAKFIGRMEEKRKSKSEPAPEMEKAELEKCGEMKKGQNDGTHANSHAYNYDDSMAVKGVNKVAPVYTKGKGVEHGRSEAGQMARKAAVNGTHSDGARARHAKTLKEIKEMPKPKLTKDEAKGVHEPMGDKNSKLRGTSRSGAMHSLNQGLKAEGKKTFKVDHKGEHQAKLKELKAMPKPNLTKDEAK